mmetsp:Transcript_8237/g.21325  ORF Transcript_8237/g.21325 Transcript_8237/m.21325 type:complete len:387 (-) Transcript_8237:179-1339(-)
MSQTYAARTRAKAMTTSGEANPSGMFDETDGALICRDFGMSAAQQSYQREANRPEHAKQEIFFYKDSTPKAEHYLSFVVDVPPALARVVGPKAELPLEVELVALVPQAGDAGPRYERVPEQSHLKACPVRSGIGAAAVLDRPVCGATLAYRIELGSYRQGDRRFAVLSRLASKAVADYPALTHVGPCLTPPVYVASKVKRHRVASPDDHDVAAPDTKRPANHSDEDHHLVALPPAQQPATAADVAAVQDRLATLEKIITRKVIPTLNRIETRLAQSTALLPPAAHHHSSSAAGGSHGSDAAAYVDDFIPHLSLERGNSEQIFNTFYGANTAAAPSALPDVPGAVALGGRETTDEIVGGIWADSMTSMGNGLQEQEALSSTAAPTAG